jgi:hypothetical protein
MGAHTSGRKLSSHPSLTSSRIQERKLLPRKLCIRLTAKQALHQTECGKASAVEAVLPVAVIRPQLF